MTRGIEFEPFSEKWPGAVRQGVVAHHVVSTDAEHLRPTKPNTVHRYGGDPFRAIHNIRRIARDPNVDPFMVRIDRRMFGMATAMVDSTVIHPDEGPITGINVDYWLKRGPGDQTHRNTGWGIILEGCLAAHERAGSPDLAEEQPQFRVITASQVREDGRFQLNYGLRHHLDPIGEPAVLTTPEGEALLELNEGGQEAQLYTAVFRLGLNRAGNPTLQRFDPGVPTLD